MNKWCPEIVILLLANLALVPSAHGLLSSSDHVMPAPFVQHEHGELGHFKPQLSGNQLIVGPRRIEITPNGRWRVLAGGEEMMTISNSFRLHQHRFVSSDSRNVFALSPLECEDNRFTLRGTCRLNDAGETAQFTQGIQLLPNGMVEITLSLTTSPEGQKLIDDESLFLSVPMRLAQDSTFTYRQEKKLLVFSVPLPEPGKGFARSFGTWKPLSEMRFMIDRPEYYFGIEPKSRAFVNGFVNEGKFNIRFLPLKTANRTARIWLDLGRGVMVKEGKTHAGIDWQRMECLEVYDRDATRNLMPNPSFEQGASTACWLNYKGFESSPRKWNSQPPRIDSRVAAFGKHSLCLNSWSTSRHGDWRGIFEAGDISMFPVPVEPGDYTFSCYVKGNRPGQTISIWGARTNLPEDIDGDRWKSLAKTCKTVTSSWQRIVLPLKVTINMPLLINMNVISPSGDGQVWIDALQLERGKCATPFQDRPAESALLTSAPNNFIEAGNPLRARLKIRSAGPGQGTVTIKDFFGHCIYQRFFNFKHGSVIAMDDLRCERGIFVVKVTLTLDTGASTYDFHRFAVMTTMNNTHRLRHLFAADYHILSSMVDFIPLLKRCRALGMAGKCWLQRQTQAVVDAYRSCGIDISHAPMCQRGKPRSKVGHFWIYLNDPTRGTKQHEEPLIKDFRDQDPHAELTADYLNRFSEAVKRRVRAFPWIRCWSFHGEDDAASPDFAGMGASDKNFENYVRLQVAFCRAVKAVDPTIKVVGGQIPCNASPQSGILAIERFLKALKHRADFDAIAVHTYRDGPENPDLDADLTRILKIMDENGYGDKPLYLPEGGGFNLYCVPKWELYRTTWMKNWLYGPLSYDMGWSEKIGAAYAARTWLAALKHSDRVTFVTPELIAIQIFSMDINMTPYASQKTGNTLARLLGNSRFKEDIRFAPYVRCYLFEDDAKRPVAVIWSFDPRMDNGTIPAAVAAASFGTEMPEVWDLMEARRRPVCDPSGRLRFTVSPFPMFLRGKPGTGETMARALRNAQLMQGNDILPVEASMRPVSPDSYHIEVSNLLSRDFTGELDVAGAKETLNIPPQQKKILLKKLPQKLTSESMVAENVNLVLDGKLKQTLKFSGLLCKKIVGKPDWSTLPRVPFINKIHPTTEADFSGDYQLAWNDEYLFIRVQIRDDQFIHEEYDAGHKRWNNDSLQIYFDTLLNARLKKKLGFDQDDYDYLVAPDATGKSAQVWRNVQPDIQLTMGTATPRSHTWAPDIPVTFERLPDGYRYDVAFPAKYLLPIRLTKGTAFGFALFVNDRDKADRDVTSCLTLTPNGTGAHNNPHLWPVLLLWSD